MSAPGLRLPGGVQLSSPGLRLVGALLEIVLVVVTLFIGWLVWSIIVWGRGQTPAKQLLGMIVMIDGTSSRAGRLRMFWRELPAKWIVLAIPGVVAAVLRSKGFALSGLADFALVLVVYMWLLWDRYNQELWDKLASTLVVSDQYRALASHNGKTTPADRAIVADAPLPTLSAVTLSRAAEYFKRGMPDAALTLLRRSAEDASRRGDESALREVLRALSQIQARVPPELRRRAAEVVRIAEEGLHQPGVSPANPAVVPPAE